jgi:two-component system sensor histidine kinase RpfC
MLHDLVKHLDERLLSNRVHLKGDLGQARLRYFVTAGAAVYFLSLYLAGATADRRFLFLAAFCVLHFALSWFIPVWVSRSPRSFLVRRLIVITNDCAGIAVCLLVGQYYAAPLLLLYFWITIVNGLRFGAPYLIYGGLGSLVCIYATFLFSQFWQTQWSLSLIYAAFAALLSITVAGCALQRRALVDRSDSEHDQALIRMVITALFMVYLTVLWHFKGADTEIAFANLVFVSSGVVLISIAIFLAISLKPRVSPARRVVGMIVDLGASSYGLIYGGEYGAPMLAVYLWVSMGNGFRYGPGYLYAATALSLAGFCLAVVLVPFWQEHLFLTVTIVLILSALPLYMVSLIRKLNQAIQSANDANRAKTQFLANMSHELRTPLNAVIGVSDLLMDADINKYQRQLARRIQSSAQLLLGMIERILDISKIETGRIELSAERFDLYALLTDVESVFQMQSETKGVRFDIRIAPDVPVSVVGDPGRVKQILVNLLGNAFKFTEQGHVGLDVYVQEAWLDKALVVFDVRDTGIGIPPSRQREIFEPFVQADDSVTRRYGGTGLGMSISRQLVEAMRGEILLDSEEGVGSRFTVKLPVSLAAGHSSAARRRQTPGMAVAVLDADGRKADLARQLEAWGFEVFRFNEPAELQAWFSRLEEARLVTVMVDDDTSAAFAADLKAGCNRAGGPVTVQLARLVRGAQNGAMSDETDPCFDWIMPTPLSRPMLDNIAHYAALKYGTDEQAGLADRYAARHGKRLRVLVAEDNDINRMLLNELLVKVGHEVVMVNDGEQAVDALIDRPFDLAILDLNMPKVSGLDTLKTCRFRRDLRDLPVMILSADATTHTQSACKEAGADMFVTKPLDSRHLLDLVADIEPRRGEAVPETANSGAHESSTAQDELIDPDIIRQFRSSGIENSFFKNLLAEFQDQGRRQLAAMRRAVADEDIPALKEQLHRLKGGASYFGAMRLFSECEAAEKAAPVAGAPEQRAWLDRIEALFHESCTAFSRFINTGDSG